MNLSFSYVGSLLFLAVAVVGTTTIVGGSSTSQAWADVIEGTEGDDFIVGTPEDDLIDSKGGNDRTFGDNVIGDGSGDDVILSGDGGHGPGQEEKNFGDTFSGDGSGDDVILSGDGVDVNNGDAVAGD